MVWVSSLTGASTLDDREGRLPPSSAARQVFPFTNGKAPGLKDGPFGLLEVNGAGGTVAALGDANRGVCPWPCNPR
jgi:hypothetical protein